MRRISAVFAASVCATDARQATIQGIIGVSDRSVQDLERFPGLGLIAIIDSWISTYGGITGPPSDFGSDNWLFELKPSIRQQIPVPDVRQISHCHVKLV